MVTTVAPAWDNERTATSTEPVNANHGQRSKNAWAAEGGKQELDICQPALAATITRDAERLCSQQRERTSKAMEAALAEVDKAERAAHEETLKHQLLESNGQARVWAPHIRNDTQLSQYRKAKVGRAVGLPSTPRWAQEFHEMKRRVSWAAALESTIDDERSPFPPGAPLQPPPPLPARRGSIVSAVLALAESPSPPPSTPPEGESGGGADKGPIVLDDDWVVRKLAQIRRRSRNIDSAIPLSGVHVSKERTTTTPTTAVSTTSGGADPMPQASGNAPVQIGTLVTLQPLLPREIAGGDGLFAGRHHDRRLSPLPPLGEGAVGFFPAAPTPSGRRHQTGNNNEIERREGTAGLEGGVGEVTTSSSDLSEVAPSRSGTSARHDRREETTPRTGDEAATRDDSGGGGGGDSAVAAVAENDRGRHSGSAAAGEGLRPTDTQQKSAGEKEEEGERENNRHQRLHDVTQEERALSLPSSSLLAADGSGELGLVGRGVRWGGGQDAGGKGKSEGGTVWSKRWKQKEAEEIAAKEEAKKAKEKRAKMVLEVLARSDQIFRSNAEKRRRRSADDSAKTRTTLERLSANKSAKPTFAGGGTVAIVRDWRPATSPVTCNGNGSDDDGDDNHHAQPRRKLSAYVRGIKESSLPAFNGGNVNANTTATGQGAASGEDKAGIDTPAVEVAPVPQGSERRDSAVTLAAKRVAARKRKEKAEKEERMREEAAKREARRAFEGSLRAHVAVPSSSSARAGRILKGGRKASGGPRRSSAPSCTSSLPSAPPSELPLGSPDGGKSPRYRVTADGATAGGARDVRVSVRVPVACEEEEGEGEVARAPAQEPIDNLLDSLTPRCGRKGSSAVESTSAAVEKTTAKTTEQRLRDRRRRHRREEEEQEERTSRLLEELRRKRQELVRSSEARRRHDASERRRSGRQTELERRRQLEQLDRISRRDARLSASARSMARRRVKAAALEAARAATADNASSAVLGGGEVSSPSLATRHHRRGSSSFGARDFNVDRAVGRQQPQVFRGEDADDGVFAEFDPRVRRNSFLARADGAAQRRATESRPGGERVGGLTPDVTNDGRSGGRSVAGHGHGHNQQRRLGLDERRKRRRQRQQNSRSRSRQKRPPRRSDSLGNDHDDVGDDNNSDGVDDDDDDDPEATAIGSSSKQLHRHPSNSGPPPGPWPSGEIANGGDNHAAAVNRGHRGQRQSTPATRHPEDGRALEKFPAGVTREGGQRGAGRKEVTVTFKPVAAGEPRHSNYSRTDISRAEGKPKTRTRREREVSEHLHAGGGGGGGAGEKEGGFESRAAAGAESRLRRRRSKSQEAKKRGDTVASAAAPTDPDTAATNPEDPEGANFGSAAKYPEEQTPTDDIVRERGGDRTGDEGGGSGGDHGAAARRARGRQGDDQDEDEETTTRTKRAPYHTLQRSGGGAAEGGAETGFEEGLDGTNALHSGVSESERGRPRELAPRERAGSGEHEAVNVDGTDSLYQRSQGGVQAERGGEEVRVLKRGGGEDDCDGHGVVSFAADSFSADRGIDLRGQEEQELPAVAAGGGGVAGANRYSNPILYRILEEEHGEEGHDEEDGAYGPGELV